MTIHNIHNIPNIVMDRAEEDGYECYWHAVEDPGLAECYKSNPYSKGPVRDAWDRGFARGAAEDAE